MSGDKSQNGKDKVLKIITSDELGLSDSGSIKVEPSDITVSARREDGEEYNLVFPQSAPSTAIATSVSDVLCIPGDATAPFQELIVESVERVKQVPWEGKIDIGLPLNKLHPLLPNLKILSLQVKSGEKTTYKKSIIKTRLPESDETGA